MITVDIRVGSSGSFSEISARGHALKSGKNYSIPCAVCSFLLRTIARTVETHRDRTFSVAGGGQTDGTYILKVSPRQARSNGHADVFGREKRTDTWLAGVTDTLVRGLLDLEQEYPREIQVKITEE